MNEVTVADVVGQLEALKGASPEQIKTSVKAGLAFLKALAAGTENQTDDAILQTIDGILSNEAVLDWVVGLLAKVVG